MLDVKYWPCYHCCSSYGASCLALRSYYLSYLWASFLPRPKRALPIMLASSRKFRIGGIMRASPTKRLWSTPCRISLAVQNFTATTKCT